MHIRLLLAALLFSFTGCTHQRAVFPTESESVVDLNKRAGQHAVTVTLADGAVYFGRALQMAADSTSWLMRNSHEVKSVATTDVVVIEIRNRGRGALEGLATGAIAGSLAGAALGLIAGDDPPCDDGWCFFRLTAGDKAQLFGITLGTISGLGGLVRGAVRGSRDVYHVDAPVAAEPHSQDRSPRDGRLSDRTPDG